MLSQAEEALKQHEPKTLMPTRASAKSANPKVEAVPVQLSKKQLAREFQRESVKYMPVTMDPEASSEGYRGDGYMQWSQPSMSQLQVLFACRVRAEL